MAVRDDIQVIKTLDGSCYCPCQDLTYRFEVSLPEYGEARIRDRGCRKRLLDVHYAHPARAKNKDYDLMCGYVSEYRDLKYEVRVYDNYRWFKNNKCRNWEQVGRHVDMNTLECVLDDADPSMRPSRHFWTSGPDVDSEEEINSWGPHEDF